MANILSDEAAKRIQAANAGRTGYTAAGSTAFQQFTGIEQAGEPAYARADFDNPPFLWPGKSYMDITGRTHKVQRGYMRSLITDANFATSQRTGAKNRRLFFQFNPQVLVRSVQQSVGAMNPLLQDPAQLAQPIPGTATFGFDLIFNREHEVNAGYNDPDAEWLKLPNGRQALVAEVGVLADLMVLDTITGQGLSKDIIDAVTMRSRNQQTNQQADYIKLKEDARKSKDFDEVEFDRSYKPVDEFTGDDMSKIFNANLGNSAFLNPLPFRVMFSSLFMVEGIATSITVEFQKFSRTMVPTICKVNVNMYALYIGVAKKDTFLYDNLRQSTTDFVEQQTKDEVTERLLEYGLKKVTFETIKFTKPDNNTIDPYVTVNVDRTDPFKNQISKNQIRDVKVRITMNYTVNGSSTPISATSLSQSVVLTLNNNTDIPLEKITGSARLSSIELTENLKASLTSNPTNKFIHYQFVVELLGTGASGSPVTKTIASTQVSNGGVDYSQLNATGSTIAWTNPQQYGKR